MAKTPRDCDDFFAKKCAHLFDELSKRIGDVDGVVWGLLSPNQVKSVQEKIEQLTERVNHLGGEIEEARKGEERLRSLLTKVTQQCEQFSDLIPGLKEALDRLEQLERKAPKPVAEIGTPSSPDHSNDNAKRSGDKSDSTGASEVKEEVNDRILRLDKEQESLADRVRCLERRVGE